MTFNWKLEGCFINCIAALVSWCPIRDFRLQVVKISPEREPAYNRLLINSPMDCKATTAEYFLMILKQLPQNQRTWDI